MSVNSVLNSLPPSHSARTGNSSPTARATAGSKGAGEKSFASADVYHGRSTDETSESPGTQSSAGIALYQRVSQYGSYEPRTSALLKSWNNIMSDGQTADGAAAAFAKALSQHEAPGSEAGVLDLTA
jgi:hypothetical protein